MQSYKEKAINLLHKKKFAKALLYFRKHYETTNNKREFYNSLGNVFRAKGDYAKAINYYMPNFRTKTTAVRPGKCGHIRYYHA